MENRMEYRTLPHAGQKVSVIGLGSSSLGLATEEERQATIQLALESGVNYFDLAVGHANVFASYGRVMGGGAKAAFTSCISARTTPAASTAGPWTRRPSAGRWNGSWNS